MHILQAIELHAVDITHKLVWTAWGHLRMQNHPTPKCFRTNASQLRYWIVFYLKFCLSEKCLWREWLDWSQLASGHFSTSACSDRLATLSLGKVRYSFGWTPGKQKWGEGKPSESPPWKSALFRHLLASPLEEFSWSFWCNARMNGLLLQSVNSSCV